jgi:hypothetical protein
MLRIVDMPLLWVTFFFGVYLLCTVMAGGELHNAVGLAAKVWILLVGGFFWLRCCVYSAPVVCIWFWQCSVVLCPGFWWGCAFTGV